MFLYQNVESCTFPLRHVQYQQLNIPLFEGITRSFNGERTLQTLPCGHLVEAKVDIDKE